MIALLDVNVLVALGWPNHVHHTAARAWFERRCEDGWATCPLTEAGFVRVSCSPPVVNRRITPLDAIAVLQELTQRGHHVFWPLDRPIADLPDSIGVRLQGYRQITDAVLLAAAMQRDGELATLDKGMERLVPEGARASLCVIPV